jgi:two-component system chemotaxis response regulator CheB
MNEQRSTEKEKVRVLVVDDAAFMIKAVSDILASDPQIEVLGAARNGEEGLEKIKELKPDVITLDVDMPVMDGLRTVRHIMIESPVPVVMLSSLFSDGAITFEALRLGVVDFLPKPSGAISQDIEAAKHQIIDRVKIAASINIYNIHRVKLTPEGGDGQLEDRYAFQPLDYLLAIGTTLGGPNTVIRLLSQLAPKLPAAVVVQQEISPKILEAFVDKFDEQVAWKVEVARDGTVIEQGTCYIATTDQSVMVDANDDGEAFLRVENTPPARPLNDLFTSAANVFESHAIGVLLTGVGDDGADGFGVIRSRSGTTIAQTTNTCVYPNLTEYAIERGTVDHVVDEKELASQIEASMHA